ncbi:restriction endonuclease subunit S [Morganella morganii]|uniref:restriction endonuclease subunit S n=1 Tax=Morganella morganii TaxID=582 RepID=UPI00293F8D4A|nr:restriction endonuclease subunit S [Morganella morganii]HED1572148.1 restriction endonuclease subunit S [Morganella morganii]
MSDLSYLEKLLDGTEVEWVYASEIFNIKNGYTPSKSKKEFWEDGDVPWFRLEDIRVNGRKLIDSIQHVNKLGVKGAIFPENSIFMSTTATIGEYALVRTPHLTNQQITSFSLSEKFKDKLDINYLFHRFYDFGEWCKENANKSGGLSIIGIKKLSLYKFPIPCPGNPEKSLAIQSEIVRILDAFTALTAELAAELDMRKKQYKHYLFECLRFTEVTQYLKIGKCCDIKKGLTPIKKAAPGKYPLVATTEERQSSSGYQFDCAAVCVPLISSRGHGVATIDRIYFQDGKFALGNILCAIIPNDSRVLSAKFLRYYLFDKKDVLLVPLMRGGANVSLTVDSLKKVEIPIPPLAEQQRIVRILDKFDELVKSLPREIELRQKQYEYYRDLLFSFPKPESVNN